ncbi:unnamed protein product [Calypogeia fissa]
MATRRPLWSLLNRLKLDRRILATSSAEPCSLVFSRHRGEAVLQQRMPGTPAREFSIGRSASKTAMPGNLAKKCQVTRALSGEPEIVGTDSEDREVSDFSYPGAKANFIPEMRFISHAADEPVPCYRVLDDFGQPLQCAEMPEVDADLAKKMYINMVKLQTMDGIFYEAQRQGRFSFYLTSLGEEAINIATPAALAPEDMVYSQYREPGILMWRGFTLEQFANQCFGNFKDLGKGRQMPIHYGSRELNYPTVSSPIATQLPQAVGAAYALKMAGAQACAVGFFGDGGSSEGDFHAAMNFASTLETPVLFICRNNGWAISTPVTDQFRSDGVVVKGRGYGVRSIRVDGNDALALYATVKAARKMAIEENRPILIEALTYRIGHHSTSDDSSKYRDRDEIDHWRKRRDPVLRFKRWMETKSWWDAEAETELRASARKEVISAMTKAEQLQKPDLSNMFSDVYDTVPLNLQRQENELRETVARHPNLYPTDVPL